MWYRKAEDLNSLLNGKQPLTYLNPPPQAPKYKSNYDLYKQQEAERNHFSKMIEPQKPIQMEATAYCGCAKCCGVNGGRKTAAGTVPTQGRTVAVPPSISLGSTLQIAGLGSFIAEDHGHDIQGNRIDVFFNNHKDALNFGRRSVNVTVFQKTV